MPQNNLDLLHSIRFRISGIRSKAVLSPDEEDKFTGFLINALGRDVFVISTGLGLSVYYTHQEDCTSFITKSLQLFKETDVDDLNEMVIEHYHGIEVLNFFDKLVKTLADHPLLLLSCCKKFMHQYNLATHKTRLHLLLYSSFQFHVQDLITEARVPYVEKIKELLREHNHSDFENLEDNSRLIEHIKTNLN